MKRRNDLSHFDAFVPVDDAGQQTHGLLDGGAPLRIHVEARGRHAGQPGTTPLEGARMCVVSLQRVQARRS